MTSGCFEQRTVCSPPPAASRRRPFISVIVPVRNEASCIRTTLGQLIDQDYDRDRFEVLVADGQSTDATAEIVREIARRYANLRMIANPRRWSSSGRNAAIRAARGEIVVVIDGHCELANRRYLHELAEAFERSGADCIGRPQPQDVPGAGALQRAIAAARSSRLGHNPDSYIYSTGEQFVRPQSVAIAYRRGVFDAIGLFDEEFDACEDVEFNHRAERAGFTCFFTSRIVAHYHPRSCLSGLFQQMVRYGRGRVRLLRKHPDTFTVPCFLPAIFVSFLMLGPALALLGAWSAMVFFVLIGTYTVIVLAASMVIVLKSRDVRTLGWLPLVFIAIHVGAGTGVLQELLLGQRRRSEPANLTFPQQPRSAA